MITRETPDENSGPRARRASTRRFKVRVETTVSVSAEVRLPPIHEPGGSGGLILAHGAGGDMHSPILAYLARGLGRETLTMRFNFPYKEAGRRAPDRAPLLEATYRAAITDLRQRNGLQPWPLFIGGKSMGGRIASHLAADSGQESPAGLVFLGYPLHPAGKPDRLRDRHLPEIRCPMLFIQGSKDRLCDLDLLDGVLGRLTAPYRLHVIDEGDHSFKVPRRVGRGEGEVWGEIETVIRAWMYQVVAR